MSGIDEQGVPQCPVCKRCHEFRVGSLTWMFPENVRRKRQLKYPLYTRRRNSVNGELIPVFSPQTVLCVGCNIKYFNDHKMYKKLNNLFDQYVRDGKYYADSEEFREDDRMSHGMRRSDIFERSG